MTSSQPAHPGQAISVVTYSCSRPAALAEEFDDGLERQISLVRRAIEAYRAGHFEAAQALAVSVCDTYLKMRFPPEPTLKNKFRRIGYAEMAEKLVISGSENASATWAFNIGYALAPVVQFLAEWRPEDEQEPPSRLSRAAKRHDRAVLGSATKIGIWHPPRREESQKRWR